MKVLGFFADVLRNRGQKGDHVVVDFQLDLIDAVNVEIGLLFDHFYGLGGNDFVASHSFGRLDLHLQPGAVFTLVGPDRTHFRQCITANHQPFCAFLKSAMNFSRPISVRGCLMSLVMTS